MCDDPNINTSSSSSKERLRINNRIEARISSLITLIDENEHVNLTPPYISNYSFEQILKRKITDIPNDETSNDRATKTIRLTTMKYHPVNIVTINVRGF